MVNRRLGCFLRLQSGARRIAPRRLPKLHTGGAQHLTMRAFMEELRSGGVETGGPAPYGQADRQNFANQLDCHLARYAR